MVAHRAWLRKFNFFTGNLLKQQNICRHLSSTVTRNAIQSVNVNKVNETIEVQFKNGAEYKYAYPWLFLQDNCLCSECFHESSKSRKRLMLQLDLDKPIVEAKVKEGKNEVIVQWSDGHCSTFPEPWLIARRFTKENQVQRATVLRDNPELFGSDCTIERANFQDALDNSILLLHLLKTLCRKGMFILEGAPTATGQVRKFVSKFGFIRTTHYGDEFAVKSERNATNIAYTSTKLCVHTDLPYYVYPPCVQLLHCIKQYDADADGGVTTFVDGFQVAAHLKQSDPQAYQILSTIPLEFADVGQDFTKFHKIHQSPTFVHSASGQLTRIVYSNQQLSSSLPVPIDKVKSVYQALKLFTNLCYDPKNLIKLKFKEGEMVVFDNWRLLHGREAFDTSKGDRHLEGCYVDWDEIYSSIRVLETDTQNNIV